MPGSPPGISVKSAKPPSRPAVPRRRSCIQNGQWSVATVWTQPRASPSHSSSRCHGSRSGGVHTKFSPPGPSSTAASRCRYCGQVSACNATPRSWAARTSASPGADDRCTTYTRAPAASASRPDPVHGLGLQRRRPGGRVLDDAGAALGQGPAAQRLDGAAVLAVHRDQPAVARRGAEHVEHDVVVDLQQPGIGQVELEAGDAPLDAVGDHPLAHRLGEGHVQPVVDGSRLGERPPGAERGERILAPVRGDVVDDRGGAPDRGRHRAAGEVVGHVHCADRQVQVGVCIDAARHHQPSRDVDDRRGGIEPGRGRQARAHGGDTAVGADEHVGGPFTVQVDDCPTAQQHVSQPSRPATGRSQPSR